MCDSPTPLKKHEFFGHFTGLFVYFCVIPEKLCDNFIYALENIGVAHVKHPLIIPKIIGIE